MVQHVAGVLDHRHPVARDVLQALVVLGQRVGALPPARQGVVGGLHRQQRGGDVGVQGQGFGQLVEVGVDDLVRRVAEDLVALAAIGLAQIGKLELFNRKRQENAAFYNAHLKGVTTPFVPEGYGHVYHQYTVRVPDGKRDALRDYLKEQGIGSEVYYPVPIHKQKLYTQELGYNQTLPETEKAALEVLSLPVHPSLSQADLETVVKAINTFMGA